MGQAVADLPNPLDAPPPASVSGTDDLLAQLAGDEIDRLLAEADVERGGAPASQADSQRQPEPVASRVPAAAPTAPTPVVESAVPFDAASALANDDELDKLLNELNKPLPKPAAEPAAVEPPKKSLTDQVPAVLAQLGETPAPIDAAPDAAPTPAAEVPPLENVMSSAEREALSLSNLEAATAAAEQEDAAAAAVAAATTEAKTETAELLAASGRPNLAVRILELMNAPLSFIPDGVRDMLGKAAIVTLVNALAVLIYVALVRH